MKPLRRLTRSKLLLRLAKGPVPETLGRAVAGSVQFRRIVRGLKRDGLAAYSASREAYLLTPRGREEMGL